MAFRVPMLVAAVVGALALPGVAQSEVPVGVPCVEAVEAALSCYDSAPKPAVAPVQGCPGRGLVPAPENVSAVRDATLCLLNEERTARRLGKLRPVPALHSVADAYAKRMVRGKFFDHTSPGGSTFLSRIKRTSYLRGGLKRWSIGENLAWGTGRLATPQLIVRAWMTSPGHRRNILNARFNELGLGVALGAPKAGVGGGPAATYVNEFGERRR